MKGGGIMPKSLRVILKKKHFEGKLTDQDYKEIIDKLDGHDAELIKYHVNYDKVFNFINDCPNQSFGAPPTNPHPINPTLIILCVQLVLYIHKM